MKSKLAYHRESRIRHIDRSVLIEFEDGFEEVKGLFGKKKKRPKVSLYRISKIEGQYCSLTTLWLVNYSTGEERTIKVSSERQVHTYVEEEY
ncbi:hypothetical protein [Bacillus phage SPO1L1]|nr:hypothetical protein [Bacillus phage SPO1L1]WIT26118.1 hypothetical protein [Bacillus phage SPO1L2]